MDININSDFSIEKSLDTPIISLDRLQLIDAQKDWENSWIAGRLQSTLFCRILEECEFNFSDFIIINLFRATLFYRTGLSDVKPMLRYLKPIITITSKEEADYIKCGFKANKNNKKIFKRIVRAYHNEVDKDKFIKLLKNNTSNIPSKISVKTYIRNFIEQTLTLNASEDSVINELGDCVENKVPALFIHNYLTALLMGYEDALKTIAVYGEILEGELKVNIQKELVKQLAILVDNISNPKFDKNKILNNMAFDAAFTMIDSESAQIQNDKAFYSQQYVKSCEKISDLEDIIEELKEELAFYKGLYNKKLDGKKVLLIGDKKKESEYSEIISSFNGEMHMYDSFDDFSKINTSSLNGFDHIIHFTYYTSHSVSDKLNKFINKVSYVNSSSKLELEKVIISL